MTSTEIRTLSPGDAMSLGELLIKVTQKSFIRWMAEDGVIREGEMRSLVVGENNFGFAPFGTDVRDMHIWITTGVCETTASVAYLVTLFEQGGIMFEK
jgi:hypothetical protein